MKTYILFGKLVAHQYATPGVGSRSRLGKIILYDIKFVITTFYAVFGVSSDHYRPKNVFCYFCIIRRYGHHCIRI